MLVLDDADGTDGLVDQAVANEHALEPVVVLLARATDADLAREILRAFRKRPGLSGQPTHVSSAWRCVEIWLRVLPITRLTIANTEFLLPSAVRRLAALRDVLLIHDPAGATAELNRALVGFARPDPSCITSARPAGPPRPPLRPSFPACPTDAFPFFLATCSAVLTADQFKTVNATYEAVRRLVDLDGLDHDPEPYETAAQVIRGLLDGESDPHRRLTLARGIEHEFFAAGWLLRVDPARFMPATPTLPVTEVATRVNWYANCELAATAALASLGFDSTTLSRLSADLVFDQTADAVSVRPQIGLEARFVVPTELWPPLLAFWIDQHEAVPSPNNGPLFRTLDGRRMGATTIRTRITRIAAETGLPVASHWTPPADQRATRWMRRHGITLARLRS
jgi:hypothetical protein